MNYSLIFSNYAVVDPEWGYKGFATPTPLSLEVQEIEE